jgi:molybdopterin-binding protein
MAKASDNSLFGAPAVKTQSPAYNPLSGMIATPAPVTVAYQPESGKIIPGYSSITEYVDASVKNMPKVGGPLTASIVAVPLTSSPPPAPPKTDLIKTAEPQYIIFDSDTMPIEIMTDLIFENIGGQELLSLSRHDLINGDFVSKRLIQNMTKINQSYNSRNILNLQNTSDKYFANYSIKLESKIPAVAGGPNNSNVYVDADTGNLIIEVVGMESDEQVEIQIGIGGTIYDTEF